MKSLSKTLILFISLLIIVSCKNNEENNQFTNSYNENGIQFSYSDDWRIEDSMDENIPVVLMKNENPSEFIQNINVVASKKDKSMDFDSHIQANKNFILKSNFKLEEEEVTSMNNQKAYRLIFEKGLEGTNYKFLQYMLLINQMAYTITFSAEKQYFDNTVQEANQIMNTFKFE